MATEYCLTYKFTNQDNTGAALSLAKSKFTLSGDTGKRIGRITRIEFYHTHRSTNQRTWDIYGRLNFSDGTYVNSNTVSKNISGTTVGYTNTFSGNLPTPSKFNTWTSIQAIVANPTSSDNYKLYWGADKDNPVTIRVYFIEAGFMRYAVDGVWKECEVFFGVDDEWKQVTPHYGADGGWRST